MSDYIADETGPDAAPIESIEQLLEHIARGAKPRAEFRVGTEYEKVAVDAAHRRGDPVLGPRGIESVLRRLADRYGWEPHEEEGRVIALSGGKATITLEPGGQIELSGEPYATRPLRRRPSFAEHVRQVVSVADELDIAFLGLGIQPFSTLDEIEWVPKKRYAHHGTVHAKVGYARPAHDEADRHGPGEPRLRERGRRDAEDARRHRHRPDPQRAVRQLADQRRQAERLPVVPRPHLDRHRQQPLGDPAVRLQSALPASRTTCDWALDVPMYFIKRRGDYHRPDGVPFRRFWKEGAAGTARDRRRLVALHLSTLFPEVRLKTYIELRMVDSQPPESMLAAVGARQGHALRRRLHARRVGSGQGLELRGATRA